ncbi:hypothetical protein [Rhodoblastus sp.]|uniref:hypothetical protein n=1 Tax=Rhodoblastus sp. TaxID=1962975 RepID=UPI0035AEEE61
MSDGASKPFESVRVFDGEMVFAFIERLARQHGVLLPDDEDGNLIGGEGENGTAPMAALQEGQNIFEARASMRDEAIHAKITERSQGSLKRLNRSTAPIRG